MALTKQQSRVYSFLETYLRRKGRPPSYQEIQDYFGFRSLNSVVKHLKQLERKGYLESGNDWLICLMHGTFSIIEIQQNIFFIKTLVSL